MTEEQIIREKKKAFTEFVEINKDACSADYETWHQVWEALIKLFALPVVSGSCNDADIDKAALKAYPPLMQNGCEYWEDRFDARVPQREAFIKGVKYRFSNCH